MLRRQRRNSCSLTRKIDGESSGIDPAILPGCICAARNAVNDSSKAARAIRQRSVSRNCQVRLVTGLKKCRQQIEQATLSAAELIELVEDQQTPVHRMAIARTQKYTGSTRQYVNRSPESIWKS